MTPKQRGRNTRRNSEGTPKQRRNPEGTPKKPRSFSASKKTRMNQRCYFLLFGLVEKVCSLNLPMELVFRMTVQYDYTESIVGIGMYFGFYRQLIAGSGSSCGDTLFHLSVHQYESINSQFNISVRLHQSA